MVRFLSSATSYDGLSCRWAASLDDLSGDWDALAQGSPTRHPHYLLDWLQPWWRHIGSARHSLRVAVVSEAGRTVAVAPFMLVRRRARGVLTIRELQWLAMGDTDQSDILCDTDQDRAGTVVAHHLIRHRHDWDELHLSSVPAGAQATQALLEALRVGLKVRLTDKRQPCLYIDTSAGDWDAYLLTTSRKFREDLRRIRRRLGEMGALTLRQERLVDLDRFLGAAAVMHGVRQHELGRESRLSTADFGRFTTEALERLQRRGMVLVWTLRVGESLAAYNLGFHMGGVTYGWNMAHDPAYSSASPGKVLLADCIERSFRDDAVKEFNLMRGDSDYKRKWTSASRDLLDYRLYNLSTPRSALLDTLRRRTR